MAQLMAWFPDGTLVPARATTYPLERVADAHRDIESGQTVGKLVLVPCVDGSARRSCRRGDVWVVSAPASALYFL